MLGWRCVGSLRRMRSGVGGAPRRWGKKRKSETELLSLQKFWGCISNKVKFRSEKAAMSSKQPQILPLCWATLTNLQQPWDVFTVWRKTATRAWEMWASLTLVMEKLLGRSMKSLLVNHLQENILLSMGFAMRGSYLMSCFKCYYKSLLPHQLNHGCLILCVLSRRNVTNSWTCWILEPRGPMGWREAQETWGAVRPPKGVMPVPGSAAQLLFFHSTAHLCKMQDLWELFDKTLNLSNLNESMSLVQKQEQFSGG